MEKVVVGMSGGVDSFVTALMLRQKGYEVIGVSLELWERNELSAVENVCRFLGIPLVFRDEKALFRQRVVDTFIQDYAAGYTPSPCCVCNGEVKWEALNRAAEAFGASKIATGHYVRIRKSGEKYYIRQGVDACKDQSYFLYALSQEILSKALTPLGDYTKEEVKAWALSHGYGDMAHRKESMGICFLRGTDYRDFIRQYGGIKQEPGVVLDRSGQVIGQHSGLLNYTVGQKRDMPLRNGEPMYVAVIDSRRNAIVADNKAGLYTRTLWVDRVVAVGREDLQGKDLTVKIRGIGQNSRGSVKITETGAEKVKVELTDPAWAVAPGQPVAFFRGDCVVGGGIAVEPEFCPD